MKYIWVRWFFFYKEWSRPSVKKEHLSLNHNLPVNLVFQDLLKSAHSTWYFLPSNCSFADSFKSDHGFIIHRGTPPRNCSRNTRASPSHGYTSRSSSMPLHLMIIANNTLRICWRSVGDSARQLSNEVFGSTAITDQISFYQKGHCLVNLLNN